MGTARAFWRTRVAAGTGTATGPELWVDASNYSQAFTDQGCADLKAAGVVGVIIQAVTGLDGRSYTRQQLAMCIKHGLRIQGYVFPGGVREKLSLFDGYALEALWLDVELPITEAGVNDALLVCDEYIGGVTGIYSGRWFFIQQGWAHQNLWSGRPLWDSHYDGNPVTQADFVPYGGWSTCAVKQYHGTTSIGVVQMLDLDVIG